MLIGWQPGITLEQVEKQVIEKAYKFFQGNKTKTADALGIAVRTLDNKLAVYEGREPMLEEKAEEQPKKRKR
jgi:DNA-binding NtrC family response regulator